MADGEQQSSKTPRLSDGLSRYALSEPTIAVFSDGAIDENRPGDDTFNLAQRIGPVYDIIRNPKTKTPLTIGIYGGWGTGKSSAMRWLQGLLNHWNDHGQSENKITAYPVWFDPWKYQEQEDVWRGLIAEVILECINVKNVTWDNAPTRVTHAAKQFGGFLGRSFLHALSAVKLKGPGVEADLGVISDIHNEYVKTAHPESGYLNAFESTLKKWVRDNLGPDERIVIFIDDLDRCLPGVMLKVLEAIKLYLGIDRLIFVIGIDRGVVNAIVQKEYDKHGVTGEKAEEYLDKMFQVEIDVAPNQTQAEEFIEQLFKQVGELAGSCWDELEAGQPELFKRSMLGLARRNPRELKRLVNSALISGAGAMQVPADDQENAMTFPQGMQVFLVRRVLSRDSSSHVEMLGSHRGVEFFAAWSEIACVTDNPATEPNIRAWMSPTSGGAEGKDRDGRGGMLTPKDKVTLHPAYQDLVQDPRFFSYRELLDNDQLGELMTIPFSTAALRLASVNLLPFDEEVEGGRKILKKIADQFSITIEELTPHHFSQLKNLDLGNTGVRNDGIKALAQAGAIQLQSLDLSGSGIDDNGIKALAQTNATQLKYLDLSRTRVSDDGIKALAQADTMQLQSLYLSDTRVSDDGIKALAQANAMQLQSLYLSGTRVSDDGIKALAQADATQLKYLNLNGTHVNDDGIKALAQANATQLQYLNLNGTHVSDDGIKALAQANAMQLQSLYLSGTRVSDDGIKAFAQADVTQLKHLNLDNTRVSDDGIKALAQADATQLKYLYLRHTRVSDGGIKVIKKKYPNIMVRR